MSIRRNAVSLVVEEMNARITPAVLGTSLPMPFCEPPPEEEVFIAEDVTVTVLEVHAADTDDLPVGEWNTCDLAVWPDLEDGSWSNENASDWNHCYLSTDLMDGVILPIDPTLDDAFYHYGDATWNDDELYLKDGLETEFYTFGGGEGTIDDEAHFRDFAPVGSGDDTDMIYYAAMSAGMSGSLNQPESISASLATALIQSQDNHDVVIQLYVDAKLPELVPIKAPVVGEHTDVTLPQTLEAAVASTAPAATGSTMNLLDIQLLTTLNAGI